MEAGEHHTTQVKRVVLASGKTIEVVLFAPTSDKAPEKARGTATETVRPEPDQELHRCLDCGSGLVHPVQWEEAGPENWTVLLRCPNCDVFREGVFGQATVEAFDEELDRGADALLCAYKRLIRSNLSEETDRFIAALEADAILPEDF
jgi:hypothetical protein